MNTAEILQEYLLQLGFKTDTISLRRFEDGLGESGKKVLKVGTVVAGVVASVEAATVAFAYSMRSMYFQSELAGTTVENLRSMEYAGKQFGISSNTMAASIHNMGQALRLNPGLQGLMEGFGVKVTGQQTDAILEDFIRKTRKMPEFIAAQYAAMFGMDADTYHQMRDHITEIDAKKRESLKMYKDAGVNPEQARKTILDYTATLDRLQNKMLLLGQATMIHFAEPFKKAAEYVDELTDKWLKLMNTKSLSSEFMSPRELIESPEVRENVLQGVKSSIGARFNLAGEIVKAAAGFVNPWGSWRNYDQPLLGGMSNNISSTTANTRLGNTSSISNAPLTMNTTVNVHGQDAKEGARTAVELLPRTAATIQRNMANTHQ